MIDVDIPQLLVNLRNAAYFTEKFRGPNEEAIWQAIALIETRLEPEWISVDERLPEIPADARDYAMHIDVLTADASGRVRELRCARQMYAKTERGRLPRWEESGGSRLAYTQPTHWRPMPTFVKPEKEAE